MASKRRITSPKAGASKEGRASVAKPSRKAKIAPKGLTTEVKRLKGQIEALRTEVKDKSAEIAGLNDRVREAEHASRAHQGACARLRVLLDRERDLVDMRNSTIERYKGRHKVLELELTRLRAPKQKTSDPCPNAFSDLASVISERRWIEDNGY